MIRRFAPILASLALAAVASAPSVAAAESGVKLMTKTLSYELPPVGAGALGGSTIFLNRCVGGCTVRVGMDDATTDTSQIPTTPSSLPEYTGFQTGEWEQVVQCVKEVYSPFNVKVTDVRPAAGSIYEEIMVGGDPANLGLPQGVGGIASISPGCAPNPKGVAFAFTSAINVFAQEAGGSRVHGLCWILAQETAHNFGLDHEYEFVDDGRSACNDPMTYRADCGGQKFYRNKIAKVGSVALCGTTADPANACRCGGNQNSHTMLLNVFGPGTSLIPPPSVTITLPADNGTLGAVVSASAGSKRGVERVDYILNGYKWGSRPGAEFGAQGQVNPSPYTFTLPTKLPNSIYDVVVRAYDDLGIMSETKVTATKGAACTSAASCLAGQKCEAGKCFWDPPSGNLGDACSYSEFCNSGMCAGTATEQICTQSCIVGSTDSCPADAGLICVEQAAGRGICFFKPEDGGCCSVGQSSTSWIPGVLGSLVFGFLVLRPRRRRA